MFVLTKWWCNGNSSCSLHNVILCTMLLAIIALTGKRSRVNCTVYKENEVRVHHIDELGTESPMSRTSTAVTCIGTTFYGLLYWVHLTTPFCLALSVKWLRLCGQQGPSVRFILLLRVTSVWRSRSSQSHPITSYASPHSAYMRARVYLH